MSLATEIGVGFPGISFVEAVDEANGFVRVLLKPWSVNQPGIDPDTDLTNSNHKTYTLAEYDALTIRKPSRFAKRIRRETYDARRGVWTYPGDSNG